MQPKKLGNIGKTQSSSQVTTMSEQNRNKAKQAQDRINQKKDQQIESMSADQVVNELKEKKLPTFGTAQERKDRLKKYFGLTVSETTTTTVTTTTTTTTIQNQSYLPQNTIVSSLGDILLSAQGGGNQTLKKNSCLEEIERLKQNREERRKKMHDLKKQRTEREQMNEAQGIKVDVDFQVMVEQNMNNVQSMSSHIPADQLKVCVCIKKRPIFANELANGEIDCVSCSNPQIIVHECKFRVDGVTKFVDNSDFIFDNTFSHQESNEDLYFYAIRPILDLVFNQGVVTIFAYGQTGSGKTFTMNGLQELAIKDLFDRGISYFQDSKRNFTVTISMYEIYGGKIYDLLNNHEQLKLLEDKQQKVQIQGLKEQFVQSELEILDLINFGNNLRTTHATKANDTSSRSHAICQIKLQEEGVKNSGKLLLVDLAGSERAQDCQSNNKDRQQEGAEINKSLLALKECLRALDGQKGQATQGQHIPFRQSKLTMVLRDSFVASEKVKIVMLACICPGSSSSDHTLNTLRYAERLKEKGSHMQNIQGGGNQQQQRLEEELRVFKNNVQGSTNNNNYFSNESDQQNQPSQISSLVENIKKSKTLIEQQRKANDSKAQQQQNRNNAKDLFYNHNQDQDINVDNLDEEEEEEVKVLPMKKNGLIGKKGSPVVEKQRTQTLDQKQHQFKGSSSTKNNFTSQLQNLNNNIAHQKQNSFLGEDEEFNFNNANKKNWVGSKDTSPQNVKKLKSSSNLGVNQDLHQQSPRSKNKISSKFPQPLNVQKKQDLEDSDKYSSNPQQKTKFYKQEFEPKQEDDDFFLNDQAFEDQTNLDDERIQAEEFILNTHLECVKEEAQLITSEGELITHIEKSMVNEIDYDMKSYLQNAEEIAQKKLEMYSTLLAYIRDFKSRYGNYY